MRYVINFDKTVNQLVPWYIGGRKLILYLQALLKPLQTVNDAFVTYAKEQRIEAAMTSQVGYFEWFLNRKFKKYFAGKHGKITITNGARLGQPIYWEDAAIDNSENINLYWQKEGGRRGAVLYRANEKTEVSKHSFVVNAPAIDTTKIKKDAFLNMLTYYIERYRIGGKTYKIIYNA